MSEEIIADLESPFRPPVGLKSRHAQSMLCSAGPRKVFSRLFFHHLRRKTRMMTLYCGGGVRLIGEYTPSPQPKALAIIIHGWLGSANSPYVLSLGRGLYNSGYSVFRLNLRDHGNTEYLNRELFLSTRLTEAVLAIKSIKQQLNYQRQMLIGFSLGGNFALRIALQGEQHGVELDQVIAICPPVDPLITSNALEEGLRVYHDYFLRKWKRCMLNKLSYFPDIGRREDFLHFKTMDEMNRYFIPRYSEFDNVVDYFKAYALIGDILSGLSTHSHIIASRDDPVIPLSGFAQIGKSPYLKVEIKRFGGHCGFLSDYLMNSWVDMRVPELLDERLASEG